MTSPWSGTSAWVNGSAIGATDVNDYINNNIDHLKSPPLSIVVTAIPTTQASTTATTAVPITAGVSATLTTYGAPVQAYFKMRSLTSGGGVAFFNLDIDGTAYVAQNGLARGDNTRDGHYHVWVTGLASGSHVFIPTWKVTGAYTAYTQASGEPINFWVREG